MKSTGKNIKPTTKWADKKLLPNNSKNGYINANHVEASERKRQRREMDGKRERESAEVESHKKWVKIVSGLLSWPNSHLSNNAVKLRNTLFVA